MNEAATGQVSKSAAEVYEEFFVPAYFHQWPALVLGAIELQPGERAVDVACGTGVLARAAAVRVGARGAVTGVDINPVMLEVARRMAPGIDWREAPAEALPFESGHFDAVLSQFGLMFFRDRRAAIREMLRVLRPGGRLAVAVCDRMENSPGYAAVTGLVQDLLGDAAGEVMRAPFVLGDPERLRAEFDEAGVTDPELATHSGVARYESVEAWLHTDVKGWTLADMIDEAQYARLLARARRDLRRFSDTTGAVSFAAPAHIVTAIRH